MNENELKEKLIVGLGKLKEKIRSSSLKEFVQEQIDSLKEEEYKKMGGTIKKFFEGRLKTFISCAQYQIGEEGMLCRGFNHNIYILYLIVMFILAECQGEIEADMENIPPMDEMVKKAGLKGMEELAKRIAEMAKGG